MWPPDAICDPAEVAHLVSELGKTTPWIDAGIGILDMRTGWIRLFTYDETDAFSGANPQLQVMAGHEAAAAIAGVPLDQARGFALGRVGADWHLLNVSHLNRLDGQTNTMQMDPQSFGAIVVALQTAGARPLIVQ